MKKLLSLLLAAMLCLNLAVVSSAAESKASSFEKLSKCADVVEDQFGCSISVLNTNVSFANTFIMESDDFLVIPKGKTLRLKGGVEIKGNIYIENGGKLIFAGGRTYVRGTIVSDGTVTVYTDTAAVFVSGALYVSPQGKLTEKDNDGTPTVEFSDKIARDDSGLIVCLGKTNCKFGDIARKPVAAVVCQRAAYTGDFVESKLITDSLEELSPDAEKYFREEDIPYGGGEQYLSVFFDNGVCLYARLQVSVIDGEMKCCSICGLDVHLAMEALDKISADDFKA
ncbi:MAG: hypothetical protein K2N29_01740 [Ruminiclostridium sp.]|nr:hypothetical protein [Ruminiclostridium sp.]